MSEEQTFIPVTGRLAMETVNRVRSLFNAKPEIKGKLLIKLSSLRQKFAKIEQSIRDADEARVSHFGGFVNPQTMGPVFNEEKQAIEYYRESAELQGSFFAADGRIVETREEAMDYAEIVEKWQFKEEELAKADIPAHFVDWLIMRGFYQLPE